MDIDRTAPATAFAEALIRAPLGTVWSVQADISRWSEWNPDIARVDVRGPLAPGTEFRWKAGGASIVSRLEQVEPPRRIAWTGRTLGIRAIHVWTFEEREGGTLVRTEESFGGLLARTFAWPMRRLLEGSLRRGLDALRTECERRARARGG